MAQEEAKKVSVAEVVEADRKSRIAAAVKGVNEVLAQHNCKLDATFILKENSIEPRITVISK